jgi:hypothetical protein
MAGQGCSLQDSEIRRIVTLLASTDLSLMEIAQRTGRSRAAVSAVNRRYQVRNYAGRRTSWQLTYGESRTSKAA